MQSRWLSGYGNDNGFCRLHYLKNWKKIKENEKKQAAKRLNAYIENLCENDPTSTPEQIGAKALAGMQDGSVDEFIRENFSDMQDALLPFDDMVYDEDVEKLIDGLKIEKGY